MTQPNALRLADVLEATDQMHANADLTSAEVAAELRRLHARVTELEAQAVSKPTRTVTYVCPVCAASLERQE
jgi:hypothetical protein